MQTQPSAFALRASTDKPAADVARGARARLGRPRLLIVGCGKVGSRIVARLNRRFRVFATTTSAEQCAALRHAGAVPILLDLDGPPDHRIGRLAPRVMCLVPPAPEGRPDKRIVDLLLGLRQPPARFIYISTTGVYGDRRGAVVDESARPAPITERARRRIDSERRARARPWRASVLRVPGIYGPGRLPLERLRSAIPAPLAADDVVTNHIHIDDLARICISSLFRAAPGRLYNAVDDSSLRLGEYLDLVADQFGLPRAPRLPWEALRRAVSPMQFSFFQESRRLSNRRIKSELKVRLQFPTARDGVIAIAQHGAVVGGPQRAV
jgi:nucleoside-diphosphate-sugar epimerase